MSSSRVNERSGSSKSLVDARETFQVFDKQKIILFNMILQTLHEISRLLNTGLDMETLAICVRLCEQGG